MEPMAPSTTAWGAARHRAVHQRIEGGAIFRDPLAVRILGADASASDAASDPLSLDADGTPGARALRFFIVARSAVAEAELAQAVTERGVTQLFVLGAGFDTFAYRNPFGPALRVFEVDHPATQAWKRERLAAVEIAIPGWLTYVGTDFERDSFGTRLIEAGFGPRQRSFVFWLGVSMYLTPEAIDATLATVAGWPGGGEIVFDYSEPGRNDMSEAGRIARAALEARVASAGEPFIGWLEPVALHARLAQLGFTYVEDLGGIDLAERLLGPEVVARVRAAGAGRGGGHVLYART